MVPQTKPVLGNLGSLGGQTKGPTNVERGLHPIFPDWTKLDKIIFDPKTKQLV